MDSLIGKETPIALSHIRMTTSPCMLIMLESRKGKRPTPSFDGGSGASKEDVARLGASKGLARSGQSIVCVCFFVFTLFMYF